MKITLNKIIEGINELFPPDTAMDGDRIGLQVFSGISEITRVLVALELNSDVIEEAVREGAELIVSFHPLIYRPLPVIDPNERVSSLVRQLIKSDISLFVAHTNFDAYQNGTSKIFADLLECETTGFLVPDKKATNAGMGVICSNGEGIFAEALIERISLITGSNIRYCKGKNEIIRKFAIVGGSGASFLAEALKLGLDAMITADVSYHTFHAVNSQLWLIDPGHYEMEQFVPGQMIKLLTKFFGETVEFIHTTVLTNPALYYPRAEENYNAQLNLLVKN